MLTLIPVLKHRHKRSWEGAGQPDDLRRYQWGTLSPGSKEGSDRRHYQMSSFGFWMCVHGCGHTCTGMHHIHHTLKHTQCKYTHTHMYSHTSSTQYTQHIHTCATHPVLQHTYTMCRWSFSVLAAVSQKTKCWDLMLLINVWPTVQACH